VTSTAARTIRYQGAIVRGHELLIIHYTPRDGAGFWMLPGGGREDESALACVAREMLEETHLVVRVGRLLLDVSAGPGDMYERFQTYLCSVVSGEARPGIEPEAEARGEIDRVAWLDLRDADGWDGAIKRDPISHPQLLAIRRQLGFG
jgi:8-oxo-dGTP pyrophosphatase MutT (NUDIX family)